MLVKIAFVAHSRCVCFVLSLLIITDTCNGSVTATFLQLLIESFSKYFSLSPPLQVDHWFVCVCCGDDDDDGKVGVEEEKCCIGRESQMIDTCS